MADGTDGAVYKQDAPIVNALLEAGADCNLQDSKGGTRTDGCSESAGFDDRERFAGSWCGLQCPG